MIPLTVNSYHLRNLYFAVFFFLKYSIVKIFIYLSYLKGNYEQLPKGAASQDLYTQLDSK